MQKGVVTSGTFQKEKGARVLVFILFRHTLVFTGCLVTELKPSKPLFYVKEKVVQADQTCSKTQFFQISLIVGDGDGRMFSRYITYFTVFISESKFCTDSQSSYNTSHVQM